MLTIKRDGTRLVVLLQHGMDIEGVGPLKLEFETGREIYAEAMVLKIQDHVASTIRTIRRDEYETGHRDGRHHISRRETFASTFAPVMPWMKERTR